jgi:hypothetical protein
VSPGSWPDFAQIAEYAFVNDLCEFVRQCAYRLIWILGWAVIVILHPGRSGCGRSPAIEVIFSEIQFGE